MGFSQWGAKATKSACTHKSTKMALTQLNQSLADDLKEAGIDYIGVHNLSPGGV
jgi:NAD(P)-dependent dehydrogenase (short-subunit alcohol dehydrogenase family)